jgi:hypothetical protein
VVRENRFQAVKFAEQFGKRRDQSRTVSGAQHPAKTKTAGATLRYCHSYGRLGLLLLLLVVGLRPLLTMAASPLQ